MPRLDLESLLRPSSIALVGASDKEHSAGRRILRNIVAGGFKGNIYPVNPRRDEIMGLRCYPSLSDLPEVPSAVFVAIAAEDGLSVIEEAGRLGVKAALTNATGFGDAGEAGRARQERLVSLAHNYGIAVCGPNNSGYMNLWDSIYPCTFYQLPRPEPGSVAFISQSGSVACAIGQDDRHLGIGYNITTGTEAVLSVTDYAEFLLSDERISTLMFFIETLRDPERFAAMARRASTLGKSLIVTKVGRSEAGRATAAAHSGALVGDDAVYDAFFERYGIMRATDLDEMLELALLAKSSSPPVKSGVVCMSISGGENGLMSDIAEDVGLSLPDLDPSTRERLKPHLSPYIEPRNPLDIMGMGWSKERFAEIIRILLEDDGTGTIGIGIDASGGEVAGVRIATDMAEVCAAVEGTQKRIAFFTNTAGGGPNPNVEKILEAAGIPMLCGMRPALGALAKWKPRSIADDPAAAAAAKTMSNPIPVGQMRSADEAQRFRILADHGVPMVESIAVVTAEEALAAASRLGLPVTLKATAPDLLHKSELGLIRLNLSSEEAVVAAFGELTSALAANSASGSGQAVVVQKMVPKGTELIIAARREAGFGTVAIVGLGGIYVELIGDAATGLGPVSPAEAREMIASTRAAKLLNGFRGAPAGDIDAAAQAVSALSHFVHDADDEALHSAEINPLIVLEQGKGAWGVDVLLEYADDKKEKA